MAGDPSNQVKFGINARQKLISYRDWDAQSLADINPNDELVVIHLAGLAHQIQGASSADMLAANTHFAEQVARQALSAGCKTFVLVSTAKVMGDRTLTPADENDIPQPCDVYGESKRSAEKALQTVFKDSQVKLIIVRPPLVYGPEAKANFKSLMQWCASGVWLPFGSINKPRSMVFIDNLCDALLWCGFSNKSQAGIYFVKDVEDLSIKHWIIQIRHMLKRPVRLIFVPVSLLKAMAVVINKTDAISKLVSPFQISDRRIRSDGWKAPFTTRQAIAVTCAAWLNK